MEFWDIDLNQSLWPPTFTRTRRTRTLRRASVHEPPVTETPAESVSKKSPRCLAERMEKGPEQCPGLIVLSKDRQLVIHATARRHGRHWHLLFRFFGDHRL